MALVLSVWRQAEAHDTGKVPGYFACRCEGTACRRPKASRQRYRSNGATEGRENRRDGRSREFVSERCDKMGRALATRKKPPTRRVRRAPLGGRCFPPSSSKAMTATSECMGMLSEDVICSRASGDRALVSTILSYRSGSASGKRVRADSTRDT